MKKSKKLAAILLAIMTTASFASCGGGSSSSSGSTSGGSDSTSDTDSAGELTEVSLPLSDELVTLTYFQITDGNVAIVKTDYNDNEFFQELEERTNVHIEWQMSSSADVQTNFNLMIASNQLPDIIYGASYYADGLEAGADDGYFMDLTDKVAEYMPNYQARRMSDETYRTGTMTDSGRIIALYELQPIQGPWDGLQIREDWLNDLGLDMPVTYDDWHEVLTAFKEEKGAYAPLQLMMSGYLDVNSNFMSGYGVTYTWQLTEDGTVSYGPYLDGWRKYITTMNQWYEEGLIDPDFMSANLYFGDTTMIVTGKSGAWNGMYSMASLYESTSDDPNMIVSPVAPPVESEGDTIHLRLPDQWYSGTPHAISANCENWEIALKWFDYQFSEEGGTLASWGVEGDTYTIDDDGNKQWTDKVLNNSEYTFAQAQACYCAPPSSHPYWYDWTRELAGVPEKDQKSYDVWATADDDWVMPNTLTLTVDESVERAGIMADVDTYIHEQTTAMITGVQDVETYWDTYISTIQGLNIDRAIEITQAAYDRYLQR